MTLQDELNQALKGDMWADWRLDDEGMIYNLPGVNIRDVGWLPRADVPAPKKEKKLTRLLKRLKRLAHLMRFSRKI
jgi:hypothetical protein